jgi:hypothetical protein
MSNIKLHTHDCKIALALKKLWDTHINPTTTQTDFAKRYGFTQNFISQVFHFLSRATHSLICAFAKELAIQPIDIDPLFNDPSRFRK